MKVVILFSFKTKIIITLGILIFNYNIFSQKYSKGLILESDDSRFTVRSPLLSSEDYSNLPTQYSLKEFAPEPGNQGPHSTCGAWATAYSARSLSFIISQSIPNSIKDRYYFSPSFVYNQLKKDSICESGITLKEALDILKFKGSIWLSEFDYSCSKKVTNNDLTKAKDFNILEYRELFYRDDEIKILKVKKSISESKPVIIAMACPNSFEQVKNVWNPLPEDFNTNHGGHALVVIGYNDDKYRGAFEVINSWGTQWGDSGFCWIRYSDFEKFVYYGYELIEKNNFNYVQPINGSAFLKLNDRNLMDFEVRDGVFTSVHKYRSKTKFEIFITNNTPVYLYCFALDDNGNFTNIFPKDSMTNNIFPYNKSTLPIPDEYNYLEIDSRGSEDFIFLILTRKLFDLKEIIKPGVSKTLNHKIVIKRLNSLTKAKPKLKVISSSHLQFIADSVEEEILPIIIKIRKDI